MKKKFEVWFRNPHNVAQQMLVALPTEPAPYKEHREESELYSYSAAGFAHKGHVDGD
jgi:hypothetical protein